MNNLAVERVISDCDSEIAQLDVLVPAVGGTSTMAKYLTWYAIIRCCGTIEFAYKNLIADKVCPTTSQLITYIDKNIRECSSNPSFDNITKMLASFDSGWNSRFNTSLGALPYCQRLKSSLSSLKENRNKFAHGQTPNATYQDVKQYYQDSIEIIRTLDSVLG